MPSYFFWESVLYFTDKSLSLQRQWNSFPFIPLEIQIRSLHFCSIPKIYPYHKFQGYAIKKSEDPFKKITLEKSVD